MNHVSNFKICAKLSVPDFCNFVLLNFIHKLIKRNMKLINELKGDWSEIKIKLTQKFALLNDSDVLLVEGKQDEMLGRLQVKLGKTKEELQVIIKGL